MASPKRAVQLGPFMKGLNTFSDPSAVPDDGLAELLNMELDLDGSLVSRPPFHDTGVNLPLSSTGNMILLGLFYTPAGAEYLIASDGLSKTYYLSGGSWMLLTNTFAATAMTQFDDKAWLLAPTSSANPGGYWSPTLGFVAEPNMPKGTVIVAFKFRLWVAQGEQATANGSRLYFSKLLGITPFWPVAPEFIDIARGDGQNIVAIERYYESLLVFRTSSIYKFSYNSDPATGSIEVSVPNVGLTSRWAIESYENYFYFFYDDRAYEYLNGRAQVISQAIKFQTSSSRSGFVVPVAVSVFNNRALFTFYDTLYVFSLVTRTWSRWRTPSRGGIGRILERRNANLPNPQAYAMRAVSPPPSVQVRKNWFTAPRAVASWGDDAALLSTSISGTGEEAYISCTLTAASPPGDAYLHLRHTAQFIPVTPGENLTFSAEIRTDVGATITFMLYWLDAGGAVIAATGKAGLSGSDWGIREHVHGVAPAGAAFAGMIIGVEGAPGKRVFLRKFLAEKVAVPLPYFSGSAGAEPGTQVVWDGPVNGSTSGMTTTREAPLYRITDAITTDYEDFQCTVRTKVLSMDTPQLYKRMFWWGLDGIFRMEARGTALPIVYGGSVTWGELHSKGITWGQLLFGTWGRPVAQGLSVETIRPELGATAQRKFTKFMKKLRFRQIQFQVVFNTRGDDQTAPVRLFSLHADVTPAQTVSKAIS